MASHALDTLHNILLGKHKIHILPNLQSLFPKQTKCKIRPFLRNIKYHKIAVILLRLIVIGDENQQTLITNLLQILGYGDVG